MQMVWDVDEVRVCSVEYDYWHHHQRPVQLVYDMSSCHTNHGRVYKTPTQQLNQQLGYKSGNLCVFKSRLPTPSSRPTDTHRLDPATILRVGNIDALFTQHHHLFEKPPPLERIARHLDKPYLQHLHHLVATSVRHQ